VEPKLNPPAFCWARSNEWGSRVRSSGSEFALGNVRGERRPPNAKLDKAISEGHSGMTGVIGACLVSDLKMTSLRR